MNPASQFPYHSPATRIMWVDGTQSWLQKLHSGTLSLPDSEFHLCSQRMNYLHLLMGHNLWPASQVLKMPLKEICDAVSSARNREFRIHVATGDGLATEEQDCTVCKPLSKEELAEDLAMTIAGTVWACLDCLQGKGLSQCRLNHPKR